jgi:hypothetical protein
VTRPKAVLSAAVAIVLVAIVVGGLAIAGDGGEDEGTSGTTPTTTPAPSEAPDGSGPQPGLGAFPPEFIQCLTDRGVDIEGKDPQELFHGGAVPPEVLNACFGALHGGGGP